uniref:Uncharacterized protein n=1 Tax=Oryza brachyantha TaxID=4533 RepID=J3MSV5_ORYBR
MAFESSVAGCTNGRNAQVITAPVQTMALLQQKKGKSRSALKKLVKIVVFALRVVVGVLFGDPTAIAVAVVQLIFPNATLTFVAVDPADPIAWNVSVPSPDASAGPEPEPSRCYVCDPAANRWVALPPFTLPPSENDTNSGLRYDDDAASATGRLEFTVALISRNYRGIRFALVLDVLYLILGIWGLRVRDANENEPMGKGPILNLF